jgi:hypothetical protein
VTLLPSAEQRNNLLKRHQRGALYLLYQYQQPLDPASRGTEQALAKLASRAGGRVAWSGRAEQVVMGGTGPCPDQAVLFRFRSATDALAFIDDPAHGTALNHTRELQVQAIAAGSALSGFIARLSQWFFGLLPLDRSEIEPDILKKKMDQGGVYFTREESDALINFPDQQSPAAMLNWLQFRRKAAYPPGHPHANSDISGAEAYIRRYGKSTLKTTGMIGGRVGPAGRVIGVLIGNEGDPAVGRWQVLAVMEYPGRDAFQAMFRLKLFHEGTEHREAGLTEQGQMLVAVRPYPEYQLTRRH